MVKLPALSLALVLVAGPAVAAGVLEDGLQSLKDAVAKKDAPLVKKLVADLYPQAREASAEAAPKNDDDKPAWTNRVELAKRVEAYTEYPLYPFCPQSPPETLVDLISTLEQSN